MDASGFEPHAWLRNGHAMTIAAAYWARRFALPRPEARLFRVAEDSQLLGRVTGRRESEKTRR